MTTNVLNATSPSSSRPIAMLSLDGGGVRGLSSLLIMRQLMVLVTQELVKRGAIAENHSALDPQEIFDAAVGTSTGGLIVLMLVKLDMTLDECIRQYKVLSGDIFSKYRCLVRRTFGSDWSKFSGRRLQRAVERLLASRGHPLDLKLRGSVQRNQMHGTVLCHEKLQGHQMFLCTHNHTHTHQCTGPEPYQRHILEGDLELRHAARATSAAPSYFEPMIIQGRSFVDGGYGDTNNPSWAAKIHYHQSHGLPARHPLVLINIGTGTLPEGYDEVRLRQRPWWTRLLPNSLVEALGLLSDLVKMATESEHRAADLAYIAAIAPERLFFQRFSADTGMHDIRLDKWQAVTDRRGRPSEIEVKTQAYLAKPDVQMHLTRAATKLADVYIARNDNPSVRLPLPTVFPLAPEPPVLLASQHHSSTQGFLSLVSEWHSHSTPSPSPSPSSSPSSPPPLPATPDPFPKFLAHFSPPVGVKTAGEILQIESRFFEMATTRARRAFTR